MRHPLSILPLLLALTFGACVHTRPHLDDSILPIKHQNEAFCTAFSINEQEGLWATARHCATAVIDQEWSGVTIGYQWAIPIYLAPDLDDVAVFQSATRAPALHLALYGPQVGDPVAVWGYPYGLPRLVLAKGYVSAHLVPFEMHSGISDILDATIASGDSGSPVLDQDGDVVGVVWGRFTESEHGISVPWETLVRTIGRFFR